jgi:hypothetical protein
MPVLLPEWVTSGRQSRAGEGVLHLEPPRDDDGRGGGRSAFKVPQRTDLAALRSLGRGSVSQVGCVGHSLPPCGADDVQVGPVLLFPAVEVADRADARRSVGSEDATVVAGFRCSSLIISR